jgi:nucleoside-diphosphate-sugar epimerase
VWGALFFFTLKRRRMFTSKSVVAITGSAGLLGTVLRQHLQSIGVKVICIDRATPISQGAPKLHFQPDTTHIDRTCDFADATSCLDVFRGCSHVVHLAASGDAGAPMQEEILPNNIIGMINATTAAKHAKVSRFIFASTNHTYHGNTMGEHGTGSFSNDQMLRQGGPGNIMVSDPFHPDSNYAVSKVFGESLGSYCSRIEKSFEFVALRIGWCAYDSPNALEGTIHDEYLKAMYLSKQDFVGYTQAALETNLDAHDGFLAAFAVSNNQTCPFDIAQSVALLGYTPQHPSKLQTSK